MLDALKNSGGIDLENNEKVQFDNILPVVIHASGMFVQ